MNELINNFLSLASIIFFVGAAIASALLFFALLNKILS